MLSYKEEDNMKKKYIILSLVLLTIVGALFTVLASNMMFSDIGNIAGGSGNSTLFVTFPAGAVALTFALAILYILRMYKHQDCQLSYTLGFSGHIHVLPHP